MDLSVRVGEEARARWWWWSGGRRRRKGRNMPLINSSATVLFSHDWVAIKKVCHNLSKLMTQWHTSSQGLEDTLTYVELVNSFIIAEIRIPALAK